MSIAEKRNLFLRLDRMIRMKVPGKAEDLAYRLGVSRSTFFRCLDDMRFMGAPIEFDETLGRYQYTTEGRFQFGFMTPKELVSVEAGIVNTYKNFNKLFQSQLLRL